MTQHLFGRLGLVASEADPQPRCKHGLDAGQGVGIEVRHLERGRGGWRLPVKECPNASMVLTSLDERSEGCEEGQTG